MRYLKVIIGVLVIIVGVIFVLQNKDLQRPIKLGFDPLYMFKAHEEQAPPPPAPAEPVATVKPTAIEGSGSATESTGSASEGTGSASEGTGQAAETPTAPATTTPATTVPPASGPKGIPAFILIFLAFFAGVLVASLFGVMEKFRLKKVVKNGNARIRELEEELKKIRNLPLTQPTTQPIITPPPSLTEPMEETEEPSLAGNGEEKEED